MVFFLKTWMCQAWEEIEPVTIAAIEGFCVGGGVALAMACDFRIAGAGAMMRLPEVPLGINMSWRSLPRLATIAGPSRAKRFTIFGEPTLASLFKVSFDIHPHLESLFKVRSVHQGGQGTLKHCGLP